MFEDPQKLVVAGTPTDFPRIGAGMSTGSFRHDTTDLRHVLQLQHKYANRYRHSVRLDVSALRPDPIVPANTTPVSASAIFTVDAPKLGLTNTELVAMSTSLLWWLLANNASTLDGVGVDPAAATDMNVTRFIAGES